MMMMMLVVMGDGDDESTCDPLVCVCGLREGEGRAGTREQCALVQTQGPVCPSVSVDVSLVQRRFTTKAPRSSVRGLALCPACVHVCVACLSPVRRLLFAAAPPAPLRTHRIRSLTFLSASLAAHSALPPPPCLSNGHTRLQWYILAPIARPTAESASISKSSRFHYLVRSGENESYNTRMKCAR